MKKEDEGLIDKQVDEFEAALSQADKDISMQQVKRYGQVNAMAIAVSLARSFAASLAVLTSKFSKKEEEKVHKWFFNCIEEEAHRLKEETFPSDPFEDLDTNKKPS